MSVRYNASTIVESSQWQIFDRKKIPRTSGGWRAPPPEAGQAGSTLNATAAFKQHSVAHHKHALHSARVALYLAARIYRKLQIRHLAGPALPPSSWGADGSGTSVRAQYPLTRAPST